jgi:pimeloyl-ACP methyl ester carboxylesterase
MGSVLTLNGEVIWPGSLGSLILAYKKMGELLDPGLVATDIIRSFSVSVQYGALISDLTTWGFKENKNLFTCPYDWRKRNEDAAEILAQLVEKAFNASGNSSEITFIAHSMGGLISRYYLESGKFNARPGFAAVRNLITLGTPHRGAPLALTAAMGMEKRLFLSAEQVQELVNDPRYPALYQLMPSPQEPFAWDETPEKKFSPVDVYDPAVAASLGLDRENLNAARDFRAVLDRGKAPSGVRYFFFGGTRQVTTSYVYVRATAAQKVRKIDVEDAGDGTVPTWSSGLGSGVQCQPVGGEHATIYKNDSLRRTLASLLGYAGVLAVRAIEGVEVAIRERVTEPEGPIHLTLTFTSAAPKVQGKIRLERAQLNASGLVSGYATYGKPYRISYEGMDAEKLSVAFDAPENRGIYKVIFESVDGVRLGEDDLFVQDPT